MVIDLRKYSHHEQLHIIACTLCRWFNPAKTDLIPNIARVCILVSVWHNYRNSVNTCTNLLSVNLTGLRKQDCDKCKRAHNYL